MPYKPKIPCSYKGCPELIDSNTGGKCKKHKAVITKEYNRHYRNKNSAKFYDSAAWKKVREAALYRDGGWCVRCGDVAADVVDHVTPITAGGSKVSLENLQSLCHGCHAIKTAEDEQSIKQSLKPGNSPILCG